MNDGAKIRQVTAFVLINTVLYHSFRTEKWRYKFPATQIALIFMR